MGVPRRVPWYTNLEWLDVYNALFDTSSNISHKRVALSRIAVWELRSLDVPVPVHVTRFLLEALLEDEQTTNNVVPPATASVLKLKMLFGMAIVRFVNSYVDVEQKKMYAESIAIIAQRIGIPSEVVDCRHRITHHEDLPSLTLLRHTAHLCFEYVSSTYWHPQAETLRRQLYEAPHHLASGLVAAVQDLQALSVSCPYIEHNAWLNALKETHQPNLTAERFMLLCSRLCHLHTSRERNRSLARLLNITVERVSAEPMIREVFDWCRRLRSAFFTCVKFTSYLIESFPHDEVLLSFLKDWFFFVVDPNKISSAPLVGFAFWILASASPNLSHRLVTRLLSFVLSPRQPKSFSTVLEPTFFADVIDFQPPVPESKPKQSYKPGSTCNAFTLWDAIASPATKGLQDQPEPYSTRGVSRLLEWCRCFLLVQHPSTQQRLPVSLEFLLQLVASASLPALTSEATHDTVRPQQRYTVDVKKATYFTQHVYQSIDVTVSRFRSACLASLPGLVDSFFSKQLPYCSNSRLDNLPIFMLLDLFGRAGIQLPPDTVRGRFLRWVWQKKLLQPPQKQQATSSVPTTRVRSSLKPTAQSNTPCLERQEDGALLSDFWNICSQFKQKQVPLLQIRYELAKLRKRATRRPNPVVRQVHSKKHLWTCPGTLPVFAKIHTAPLPNTVAEPHWHFPTVVQLLPLSGGFRSLPQQSLEDVLCQAAHLLGVEKGSQDEHMLPSISSAADNVPSPLSRKKHPLPYSARHSKRLKLNNF